MKTLTADTTYTAVGKDHYVLVTTVVLDSRPITFEYTLNMHSIHMRNAQEASRYLIKRQIRCLLAAQVLEAAKKIESDCLKGRTVTGLSVEFICHYLIYRIIKSGYIGRAAAVTDSGSLFKTSPGYDNNAWFFEGPLGICRMLFGS